MKLQVPVFLFVGYLIPSGREDSSKSFSLISLIQNFKKLIVHFETILTELVCSLVSQNLTTIFPDNFAILRTSARY